MATNRPGYRLAYLLLQDFARAADCWSQLRQDRDEGGNPKGWRVRQFGDRVAALAERLAEKKAKEAPADE
jgi:hypothetical protein